MKRCRSKSFALIALVGLVLPVSGCGSVPGKDYIQADRKTYTAVAPRLTKYLDAHIGPDGKPLDKDDEASARDTLASWDLRLKEGERVIAERDGTAPKPAVGK